MDNSQAPWQTPQLIEHIQRLESSFHRWTGRSLLPQAPELSSIALAEALFQAPFVLASHGTEADPILNYGNQTALNLWALSWEQFTQTPSRYTAEPIERDERERLLQQVQTQGFISDYRGIRISSQGQRFWIQGAIVWDVLDADDRLWGQAVTFSNWQFLEPTAS